MIPESNHTMESIIKFHSSGYFKKTSGRIFDNKPNLDHEIKSMGLPLNPKLSELHTYFKHINQLRETFDKKCELAGTSNLISCLDNKIYDIKSKYEIKPLFPRRGMFPQPEIPLEVDLRDIYISWPPAYVAYHSWQEGYDAKLHELGFLTLFEVQSVENLAVKNIKLFLRQLYLGVAHAKFLDELISQRTALTKSHPTEYGEIADKSKRVVNALAPLKGNNFLGQKIMSTKEFDRLLNYTLYLVEHEKSPKNIVPISADIPNQFIRRTFFLLHKSFYKRQRREYWFDFLREVFTQFNSATEKSLKSHFSSYTGNFDNDRERLLESQKSPKSQ